MTSITIRLTPQWIRANERAVQHAAKGLRAACVDCRHYTVPSASSSTVYHQTVNSISALDVECDCPAGRAGKTVCWHKSAAMSAAIKAVRAAEREREQQPSAEAARTAEVNAFMARFAKA